MTYDLARLHANPPHEHTKECAYEDGNPAADQFLRCLKAELDQIRADIHE